MIYEYAFVTVPMEQTDEFEASFPAARSILLSSPGCRSAEFQASVNEPGVYFMKVGWDRVEDHLETFASSPAAQELIAVFGRFFAEPAVVAHFPADSSAP